MTDLLWIMLIVGVPYGLLAIDEAEEHTWRKRCDHKPYGKHFTCYHAWDEKR